MPRLSVDLGACRIWGVESDLQPTIPKSDRLLDLVLPDHTLPWAAARKRLQAAGFQVSAAAGNDGQETRLELTRGNVLDKVEVNFVMRGPVNPVVTLVNADGRDSSERNTSNV